MKNKKDLIRLIRRSQQIISILLFALVFSLCWNVTNFEITQTQLSKWGEQPGILGFLWNAIICVLSISILINAIFYVKRNKRIKRVKTSIILFSFTSLCLFVTGAFNLNYPITHNIAAYSYFFSYPLIIFIVTYINKKTLQYKEWVNYNIISMCMIIIPLLCIYLFEGMAIAEIAHIIFVLIWNLKILFKPNQIEHHRYRYPPRSK